MAKFKSCYNFDWKNYGEKFILPSLTVPNQAMSIPEMIKRYAQGLPLGAPKVPIWDEDPENDLLDGRNWNTLDLSEQHDFMRAARNELESISERLKKPSMSRKEAIITSSEENNPL